MFIRLTQVVWNAIEKKWDESECWVNVNYIISMNPQVQHENRLVNWLDLGKGEYSLTVANPPDSIAEWANFMLRDTTRSIA